MGEFTSARLRWLRLGGQAPAAAPEQSDLDAGADAVADVLRHVVPECVYGAFPVRDIFPSRPASRGAINYPTRDPLKPLAIRRPGRRGRRLRAWWRRHWWPARIRDLEAQIERYDEDVWY